MKTVLILIACSAIILITAILVTLNVPSSYTTLIRIKTQEQYTYIIAGKEPIIEFDSLKDTPYGDEVKILKIKYRVTPEHLWRSGSGKIIVDEWLSNTGIISYPEFVK